jgi:hypothetical protein
MYMSMYVHVNGHSPSLSFLVSKQIEICKLHNGFIQLVSQTAAYKNHYCVY